uniref:Uncharacterized protein n=1 Tax=Candidatus Kentrum sp. MB TaxID=2138164 RepID=A0A451BE53_9GAMM|nr:MAG: hypothetical protein BECKMB1821I_GA0114274_10602 [Candidatus Kentron sp. MB]VFK76558.1 MAG: hypothetical protein BECKMB1821H_GA0114242_10633 [Candidatus Kentron sp. MB]
MADLFLLAQPGKYGIKKFDENITVLGFSNFLMVLLRIFRVSD